MGALLEILERLGGERRIHYDLVHFQEALTEAGNPEKTVKSIVIAGTNGKGTVTLLISAALRRAGFKVGTYLSPHLQSVTERFHLNLAQVPLATLDSLATKYEGLAEKFKLTYFEFLTLIYFVLAKNEGVDYSVLEVGLGGRLDATNVTEPVGCILTTIGIDHEKFLGDTEERILDEKMGILRHGVPVISGISQSGLKHRLKERCRELGAKLTFSHPTGVAAHDNADIARTFLSEVFPNVRGDFSKVRNCGRFEVMQENPRVILSGDHNPHGIESLVRTVKAENIKNLHILCAFSPDKPYARMFTKLKELSPNITLTVVQNLKGNLPKNYFQLGRVQDPAKKWIEKWIREADPSHTLLITGSLYLVGEVRSIWKSAAEYFENP